MRRALQRANWMIKQLRRPVQSFVFIGGGNTDRIELPEAFEPGLTRVTVAGTRERNPGDGSYQEETDSHGVYRYIRPLSTDTFRPGMVCRVFYVPRTFQGIR